MYNIKDSAKPIKVFYFGETGYKGSVGSIQSKSSRSKDMYGVAFRANHQVFISPNQLVQINADKSIPDGIDLTECYARVTKKTKSCYLDESAVGHVYPIEQAHREGVMLSCPNEEYGNNYYIGHDCYKVVSNYKTAWVWMDLKLHKKTLSFKDYVGQYVIWEDTDSGRLIKDTLVLDTFTEAVEKARLFIQNSPIEVVK